ncbi:hypothetical protein ABCR94_00520 [Streptomyces sp. 21So2-11]|uniref:hypothetical protein n=1 Tax=Streptomyces sp. 21So2-11 TaxID=3144408 RepID=UPI00321A4507
MAQHGQDDHRDKKAEKDCFKVWGKVATKENSAHKDMTHTIPYDEVSGRKSAEEMTAALAAASGS